jgi:hydrogenase maturation factor HypF (carbamoyltransferase family)
VFQNARLTRSAADAIARKHLDVMEHRCVPCNDGGLSLGQALQAIRVVRANGMNEGNAACV